MELLSHIPVAAFPGASSSANDCWGYTSPLGRRYAIIGLYETTAFVDITEPRSPVVVADIPDASSIWSDIKVYRKYAYNGNETGGGIQVLDMTQIDPPTRTVTLVGTFNETGINTTHTIALNEESGFMYLNGAGDLGGGRNFIAVDVSDPRNPSLAGEWLGPGATSAHDSQVVTYHTGPYAGREIAFLYAGDAFKILDVTDKSNMLLLSILPDADSPYPTLGYNHQGWLTEDRKYVVFNDEFDELSGFVSRTTTYVVDVQDLLNPTIATTFGHPTGCWIDHDEHVKGRRVYQAQYTAGVRVLDIADPLNPSEVAYFDTHPENNSQDFSGVWGVYPFFPMRVVIASDIERGLFVLCDQRDRPLPGFTVDANPVACGSPLGFDASSSTHCNPTGSVSSYEWDFDYDGSTFDTDAAGISTTHRYPSSGVFRAALRVTDGLGVQEFMLLDITVECTIPAVSQRGALTMFAALVAIGLGIMLRRRQSDSV
jgi:choice-of-anchor B domain-containing protein